MAQCTVYRRFRADQNSTRAPVIEIDCLLGEVENAYRTGLGLGTMGAENACKWA